MKDDRSHCDHRVTDKVTVVRTGEEDDYDDDGADDDDDDDHG